MSESESEEEPEDDSGSTTTSTKTRWEWTGTIAALVSVLVTWIFGGYYIYTTGEVPVWLTALLTLEAGTSTVWIFGSGAANKAMEVIK